ncbi:MAG: SAM-dependent chlorinase/fluorinase [Bacteroidales bacterium]|nr:SAM-dependent chlorinase/fluorinase [Bacteroidales bacterium]
MKNITLISDWKLRDPYVAMLKGQLWKAVPDANIIDITHAIEGFSIEQTAFILKSSYSSFPEGTLHIILTGITLSHESMPVMVEYDHHFFMGEDSGVFSLMFGEETDLKAVALNLPDENSSVLDKCVTMAKLHFSNTLQEHVRPYDNMVRKMRLGPEHDTLNRIIIGHVAYIDTCCNAVTDIPVEMFKKAVKKGNFSLILSSTKHITITHYQEFYNPKEEDVYVLSNRLGFMELTLNNSRIAVLADLHIGDKVEIRY